MSNPPPVQFQPPRLLITAGPTHEPIDAVRFIGNRSSGRLGAALADEAARRGHKATLLLGPCCATTTQPAAHVERFTSCADLATLLASHAPAADIVIMAAAVADFRPAPPTPAAPAPAKLRRTDAGLTLALEPTPDLLAGLAAARPPTQLLVGFALEPADGLIDAARAKMARKRIGMIVANPLDTMESPDINATILWASGQTSSPGPMPKVRFAAWLLDAAIQTWRDGAATP